MKKILRSVISVILSLSFLAGYSVPVFSSGDEYADYSDIYDEPIEAEDNFYDTNGLDDEAFQFDDEGDDIYDSTYEGYDDDDSQTYEYSQYEDEEEYGSDDVEYIEDDYLEEEQEISDYNIDDEWSDDVESYADEVQTDTGSVGLDVVSTSSDSVEASEELVMSAAEEAAYAASSGSLGSNITWVLDEAGVLTISGTGDMADLNYKEIPWYASRNLITKVIVEEGVTSICQLAFSNCRNLNEVILPDSVIAIGYGAFDNCIALEEIDLPKRLLIVNAYAFENTGLVRMSFPDSVCEMGYGVLRECEHLMEVHLPESLTVLKDTFFYNSTQLAVVNIPPNLKEIGRCAFQGTQVTEVEFPATLSMMGFHVFLKCLKPIKVRFLGDVPINYEKGALFGFSGTVYYPGEYESWTDEVFRNLYECHYEDTFWEPGYSEKYKGTLTWEPYFHECVELEAEKEEGEVGDQIILKAHINTDQSVDEIRTWTWSVEGPENRLPGVLENGLLLQDIAYNYLYTQQFHASEPGIYKVKISGGTEETTDEIELKIRPKTPENIKGSVNQEGYVRLQWDPVDKADGYYIYYVNASTGKEEKRQIPINDVKEKKGKATVTYNDESMDTSKREVSVTSYVLQGERILESKPSVDRTLAEGIEYSVKSDALLLEKWSMDEPEFLDEEDVPWRDIKSNIGIVRVASDNVAKFDDYSFKDCYNLRAVVLEQQIPLLHQAAFTGSHVTVYYNGEGSDVLSGDGIEGFVRWRIEPLVTNDEGGILVGHLIIDGDGEMETLTDETLYDAPWSICTQPDTTVPNWLEINEDEDNLMPIKEITVGGNLTSIGSMTFRTVPDAVTININGNITRLGSSLFTENSKFGSEDLNDVCPRTNIRFEVNAPEIATDAFFRAELLIYCRPGDDTWTEEKMKDYGGRVSWGKIWWEYKESEREPVGNHKQNLELLQLTVTGDGPIPDYYNTGEIPWYPRNNTVTEICIEEGVTGIGSLSFYDMKYAEIITIPSTVRKIGENAFERTGYLGNFDGGPQIRFEGPAPEMNSSVFGRDTEPRLFPVDIYYPEEAAGWNAAVHDNYKNSYLSFIPGTPADLVKQRDMWGFQAFDQVDKDYFMLAEDGTRLLSDLDLTEKIQLLFNNGKIGLMLRYHTPGSENDCIMYVPYAGSCRGFSITEGLVHGALMTPSCVNNPLCLTEPTESVRSFINFYHLQQFLPAVVKRKARFEKLEQSEQLAELEARICSAQEAGEMVEISFKSYGYNNDGILGDVEHTIMGYALETGEFHVNLQGIEYIFDHRILTYDPNQVGMSGTAQSGDDTGFNYHSHAFYYSTSEAMDTCGTWMIPYRRLRYPKSRDNRIDTSNPANNAKLLMVGSGYDYLNAIDYTTGTENLENEPDVSLILTSEQEYQVTLEDGRTYTIQGSFVSGDGEAVLVQPTGGEETPGGHTLVLPDNSTQYDVVSPEGGCFTLYSGETGRLVSAELASSGAISYSDDGKVTVAADELGVISLTLSQDSMKNNNGEEILPQKTVELKMDEVSSLQMEIGEDGLIVSSDNKGELQISTIDDEFEQGESISYDSDGVPILITTCEEDEEDIEIRKDPDGDGVFDLVVANTDNLAMGRCDGFDWVITRNGMLRITGDGAIPAYQSDYADEEENEDGREEAPWERYRETIVGVTIEEGITSIGDYVFAGATSLKRIAIPPSVTEFGENIFAGCSDVVIYGDKDSGAELYAKDNSLLFIDPERVECAVISGISDKTYTGTPIIQDPVVELDGQLLIPGQDYTVSYENNLNAGEATVTITGRGAFSGAASVSFVIKAKSLKDAEVSAISDKTYTGSAFKPQPVVTLGAKKLVLNQDYYLAYKNNTNVGKATIAVKGMGNYGNVAVRYFNIKAASVKNASITGITSKVYTGSALTQKPVVKIGGKTLKLNTDYYLAYKNNINTGKATIAIKGKGNYNNVAVRYFAINPKPSWIASLSSPKTKQIKITWGKRIQISGYQIEISTKKNFAKPKQQKNVYDPKKLSMTVSVSKAKTTYYVRIRSFKKTKDKTYFSAWSATKAIKTK